MSLSSLPLRDLQYDGHARLVLADARAAFAQPAAPSSSRTVKAGHPTPSECSKTRTSASGDSPLLSSAAGDGLEAAPSSRVSVCSSLATGSAGPPSARISFPSGGTDFRSAAATSGDAPLCLMSTLDGLVPSSPSKSHDFVRAICDGSLTISCLTMAALLFRASLWQPYYFVPRRPSGSLPPPRARFAAHGRGVCSPSASATQAAPLPHCLLPPYRAPPYLAPP